MVKYEKLVIHLLFNGGLIYYLNKEDAGNLLMGAAMAMALHPFILVINDRDTNAAYTAILYLFLSFAAFLLA